MRWDDLFDDLEAQLGRLESDELASEVADRTRRESSLLRLVDRLVPSQGCRVTLLLTGAGQVSGLLTEVGVDWLLVEEPGRTEVLVNAASLLSVAGVTSSSEVQTGEVWRKLDLRWALRGLARSRSRVQVVLKDGAGWHGTIDRVGADHVELAEHPSGEQRRAPAVRQVVLLPVAAIALVRNQG